MMEAAGAAERGIADWRIVARLSSPVVHSIALLSFVGRLPPARIGFDRHHPANNNVPMRSALLFQSCRRRRGGKCGVSPVKPSCSCAAASAANSVVC